MRFRVLSLFLILSFSVPPGMAAECLKPSFKTIIEEQNFHGETIPVRKFPFLDRAANPYGVYEVAKLFGSKSQILLGIQDFHFYLYVDGVRFDGGILSYPEIKSGAKTVRPGWIVRFPNAKPQEIQELRQQILGSLEPTITCAHGVCSILSEAGYQLPGGKSIRPSKNFDQILKKGFRDADGNPLNVEVYSLTDISAEEFLKMMKDAELEYVLGYLADGAALIGGGTAVFLISKTFRDAFRESKKDRTSESQPALQTTP